MNTVFARIIAFLLGIIAIFTGGNMKNVTIEVENEITDQSEQIVFEVFNYTGRTLDFGEDFTLEVNQDGEWVEVKQVSPVNDIAHTISNLGTAQMRIDIVDMFGKKLDVGEYRLTKAYAAGNTCSVTFNVVAA